MPTNNPQASSNLEQTLMAVWDCGFTIDEPETTGLSVAEATQAITLAIESCVPKKTVGAPADEYETGNECGAYADGYNQAIDEISANLSRYVGEKK